MLTFLDYENVAEYKCVCPDEYTGPLCERRAASTFRTDASEVNECTSSTCRNGGTCNSLFDSLFCECPEEYFGSKCQFKRKMREKRQVDRSVPSERSKQKESQTLERKKRLFYTPYICFNPCPATCSSNSDCERDGCGNFKCICDAGYTGVWAASYWCCRSPLTHASARTQVQLVTRKSTSAVPIHAAMVARVPTS